MKEDHTDAEKNGGILKGDGKIILSSKKGSLSSETRCGRVNVGKLTGAGEQGKWKTKRTQQLRVMGCGA